MPPPACFPHPFDKKNGLIPPPAPPAPARPNRPPGLRPFSPPVPTWSPRGIKPPVPRGSPGLAFSPPSPLRSQPVPPPHKKFFPPHPIAKNTPAPPPPPWKWLPGLIFASVRSVSPPRHLRFLSSLPGHGVFFFFYAGENKKTAVGVWGSPPVPPPGPPPPGDKCTGKTEKIITPRTATPMYPPFFLVCNFLPAQPIPENRISAAGPVDGSHACHPQRKFCYQVRIL